MEFICKNGRKVSIIKDKEADMDKFVELRGLYSRIMTLMSAVCARKGLDMDNYSGRFFAADLLELLIAVGEKAGADVKALSAELAGKKDITPSGKPIYKMTLEEFERLVAWGGAELYNVEN